MRKLITLLFLLLLFLTPGLLFSQTKPVEKANYQLASRFSPKKIEKMVFSTSVDPHWLKNSERFWYSFESPAGKTYYIVDPAKKFKKVLFDNEKIAAQISALTKDPFDATHLPIMKIKFIKGENTIRFEITSKLVEQEKVNEEETDMIDKKDVKKTPPPKVMEKKTFYFEYDLTTEKLTLLDDYKKPKDRPTWASISPDSSKIVFSRKYNLYWMDKANYLKAVKKEKDSTIVEHQMTKTGEKYYSFGYNRDEGTADEEKNKDKRQGANVIWSPDSKHFVLSRSDSRKVKDLWVINSLSLPRPTLETYKYEMPGDKDVSQEELLVFNFETKDSLKINIAAFKDQNASVLTAPRLAKDRDEDYVSRKWLSESNDKIYFERLSRDMKRMDICMFDLTTGKVKVLIEERLNTYIESIDLGLVNNGKELIHWSERDGWGHFYLYDGDGKLKNQITSGSFHCQSIEGIDNVNRVLYFTANNLEPNEDPYYLHLYKINFDGTGLKLLNKGNFNHQSSISDSRKYFVNNFSRVNTIPESALMDNLGNKVMDLEKTDLSLLFQTGYKFPEIFKVKADDGITDLYGAFYKPFDFDSTKHYPVIEYVYPGPQTEAVNKSFSARMDRTDRLAQFGFIVVTVGNRGGNPARSKWYHNYGYGNLRNYGLADKKAAVEQLTDKYKYMDISRVGITGHSGGGFMSTAAMLVYPDFFKVAVSCSGNHENNIYNAPWSEKHDGIKEIADSAGKVKFEYDIDKNSDLAKNLKGHLLLTTGDIDNNVHPGNTFRIANALIKANKRFDLFIFPGQRHAYTDMTEYFFWKMGDYFSRYLLGDVQDSVDMIEIDKEIELK
jgi:dipeptidyl-peptidase-4